MTSAATDADGLIRGDLDDAAGIGRSHSRVEHRHPVQDIFNTDRIYPLVADTAGEFDQLGLEHVEAAVLDDLVGRCDYRAIRRLLRYWHEANALQRCATNLRHAHRAISTEAEIRGGGDRAED